MAPACIPGKPPVTLPLAPTGLVLNPLSTSQIQLDWTDNAVNETSYVISRSTDGTTYTVIATVPANTTTYNDYGLQPSTFYYYRVEASNSAGNSAPSEDVNVTMDLIWNGPTTGGPLAREFHSAVYDSVGQRMLLFGGAAPGLQQDLWELSLPDPAGIPTPTWSPLAIAGPPSARAGHSAIFDAANNRMIVFGGQSAGGYLNEVWVLSFNGTPAWTQITGVNLGGTPPAGRRNHTAVFDPIRQEMIIHGGSDASGFFSDACVLSLPASPPFIWSSPVGGTVRPCAREAHAAVHDPLGPRMVIFGGHDNDTTNGNSPSGGDGSTLNQETWSLDPLSGYVWTQLITGSAPSLRQGHSGVYDAFNRRMVIFGGGDDQFEALNPGEMWALNLSTQTSWTLLPTSGGPAGIFHHSAVYDALWKRMVLFGGRTTSTPAITLTDNLWWIGF